MIIFGGSFDPVHLGHVRIISALRRQFKDQRIQVIPCYVNPLKSGCLVSESVHRIRMLELVKMRYDFFQINDIEIKKRSRYTYETVGRLRRGYGGRIYLVVGLDSFLMLDMWKNAGLLKKWVNFIVVKRRGYREQSGFNAGTKCSLLRMRYIDVSSSQIRENVITNRPINHLVTKEVAEYIRLNNLYRK